MIHFTCTCGNTLFFENTLCLKCGSMVGYDLVDNVMKPATNGYAQCRNGVDFGVCNWLVPVPGPEYCTACALNHMVPDLSVPGNQDALHKMETAKRRAIFTLARLSITPADRKTQPEGLAFDFLTPIPALCVMTGHREGASLSISMRRMISTASGSGTTWGSPTAPSWDTSGSPLNYETALD